MYLKVKGLDILNNKSNKTPKADPIKSQKIRTTKQKPSNFLA